MTGVALVRCTGIMHPSASNKRRRGVTEMTIQSCRDVVHMLASSGVAVVAGHTIVGDTGMVEYRTDKGIGVMA